jgi:hypothetical protein
MRRAAPRPWSHYQVVEKIVFRRLFKNIQMQGTRNPEEQGVHASLLQ